MGQILSRFQVPHGQGRDSVIFPVFTLSAEQSSAGKGQALLQRWLNPFHLLGASGSQLSLLSSICLSVFSCLHFYLPERGCCGVLAETPKGAYYREVIFLSLPLLGGRCTLGDSRVRARAVHKILDLGMKVEGPSSMTTSMLPPGNCP